MSVGSVVRVIAVLAAVLAAVGSAASNQDQNQSMIGTPYAQASSSYSPPPPQAMDAARALGLWRTNFGAVKIEADDSRGGLAAGAVHGIWVYRNTAGQEVIGYFNGNLRGNVLRFGWQEPPLNGNGYLVFDASGQQYSGRWWNDGRDRVGDWNGRRQAGPGAPPPPSGEVSPNPYEGAPSPDADRDDAGTADDGDSSDDPYAQPAAPPQGPGSTGPQPEPRYY